MDTLYTTAATAVAGRAGYVKSEDGKIDFQLSVPKAMGGDDGPGTNPEQLFASGYAACFGGALKKIAGDKKITVGEVSITAKVSFGKIEHGFKLGVELIGKIGDVSKEQAQELMELAHEFCPYSRAVRNNIDVKLSLA